MDDDFLGEGGAAILDESRGSKRESDRERQEFLETIRDTDQAELIETKVTLVDGFAVTVSTKLDGHVTKTMADIDRRVESIESGEGRAYELQEVAELTAELMSSVIAEDHFDQSLFMEVYDSEGMEVLVGMMERVFEGINEERKRRMGAADGFRAT